MPPFSPFSFFSLGRVALVTIHIVLERRVQNDQARIKGDVALHHQLPDNVNVSLIIHYRIFPHQSIGRVFVLHLHLARIRAVKMLPRVVTLL